MINEVNPKALLVAERLDIAARIPLAKSLLEGGSDQEALELYSSMMLSDSPSGKFFEEGQIMSLNDRVDAFAKLAASVREFGFRQDRPVPVRNGVPVNGAHRIATSIAANVNVFTVEEATPPRHDYSYRYFESIGSDPMLVIQMSRIFIQYADKCRVAAFWQEATAYTETLIEEVGQSNVIYRAKFALKSLGRVPSILEACYGHEPWFSSLALPKLVRDRKLEQGGVLELLFFQLRDDKSTLDIKTALRNLMDAERGLVPHLLHIGDSNSDAIKVLEALLADTPTGLIESRFRLPMRFAWEVMNACEFLFLRLVHKLPNGSQLAVLNVAKRFAAFSRISSQKLKNRAGNWLRRDPRTRI